MWLLLAALGCERPTAGAVAVPEVAGVPGADRPRGAGAPAPVTLPLGLSDAVARVIDRYPIDGSYAYRWPPDDGVWWGTTREVRYGAELRQTPSRYTSTQSSQPVGTNVNVWAPWMAQSERASLVGGQSARRRRPGWGRT